MMRAFYTLLFTAISFTVVQAAPAACPPGVNSATLSLIKEFEGFVPKPAPDPIGLPTVGYGHLCKTKGCSEVKFPLTKATASTLLVKDLKQFESCLNRAIKSSVKLNAGLVRRRAAEVKLFKTPVSL